MKKRSLLAALLLSAGAGAQETTWKIEFLGLSGQTYTYPDENNSVPNASLSGLVKGEDRNGDRLIDKSELSEFRIGNDGISGNFAICDSWQGTVDHHCTLNQFSFAPDAPLGPMLEMTGKWVDVDESALSWRTMDITVGGHYRYDIYKGSGAYYGWTGASSLRVTQVSPVPEPAGGLMLAAGLLLAAGARRRITAG